MATWQCNVQENAAAWTILQQLDAAGLVAADHRLAEGGRIQLTLGDEAIAVLEAHGLEVVRGARLKLRAERDDAGPAAGAGVDLLSGFVTGYLDGVEIADSMAALAAAHPARCSLLTLPHATAGYDGVLAGAAGPATVRALRITATPALRSRPGMLVLCGTHAREWMNPLVALEFAGQLLANYDPASVDPQVVALTRIVDEGDLIIVPALNPDGLNFSVHDDPGWRKNRRPNAGAPTCPGVDDNRNFEVYFGGAGSSGSACSDAYRGPHAFSEAETRNVRWLLEEFPNLLVGVDSHSYGRLILRPGPGGGSYIGSLPVSAADDAIYSSLENTLRSAIAAVNGVSYALGSTSNHAGTSDEYLFFGHRVFGFNTECGTSFQPAWADALPVIHEMVAGLRALALATLDLTLTTPAPLQLAQCLDRTGSMVALGYEAAARANAKRFVDLMSLGDSTAIVSFADPSPVPGATPLADLSRIEFPLTLLDDPGDAGVARAAIDAIAFGGWTPIGAGLQRAADVLAGVASPRAILLVSDGYDNRAPSALSTLATWPADLRVFTVALGPSADIALLQQIATQTGGVFQASPTALDLQLVYNQMRADISDEGLLLNVANASGRQDGGYDADVEPAADWLTITVSTLGRKAPAFSVHSPSGRAVRADDFAVHSSRGDGYAVVRIARPAPGRWKVRMGPRASAHVVAAFVTSPLHLRILLPKRWKAGAEAKPAVQLSFEGKRLAPPRLQLQARTVANFALPRDGLRAAGARAADDGVDKSTRARVEAHAARLRQRLDRGERPTEARPLSRLEIEVMGQLPGGAPFRRVAIRTVSA